MRNKIIIMLAIAVFVVGCDPQESQTIDIGALLFFSEPNLGAVAYGLQEGIDLAVEEINNNGGILGKKIRIIYEDTQMDGMITSTATQKLLNTDKVKAAFIGVAPEAKVAGPLFQQQKVPLISLWDANKELEEIGDYSFGIGFSTEYAGEIMAEKFYEKGIRKVTIANNLEAWSLLISKSFKKKFIFLGGEIMSENSFLLEEGDFRTAVVKSLNADAIYAPLSGHIDVFYKQARELGYKGLIASGDALTGDIINSAGKAAEGIYFTSLYVAKSKKLKELEEKYMEKYGQKSEFLIFNALAYDAVYVLAEAIKIAGSDNPEAIKESLYKIKGFQGVSGVVDIGETGFSSKKERIFVVENGEMILID